MDDLLLPVGEVVGPEALTFVRAAGFVRYVLNPDNADFELWECRRTDAFESVAITVRAEVPQRSRYDIRYEEPLLIAFFKDDWQLPDVLSMRRDFPDVPHLNLRREEVPKSLCLFGEPPEDLRLLWSPALLGARILWWLRETARGTLHRQDQALEPFLGGLVRPLIVPPNLFSTGQEEVLAVSSTDAGLGRTVLVADRTDRLPPNLQGTRATLLAYRLPTQEHGVIRVEPQTLSGLHLLCLRVGFDLLQALRATLYSRIGEIRPSSQSTILLLAIPKARTGNTDVETVEWRGFRCGIFSGDGIPTADATLDDVGPGKLGEVLGVLGRVGDHYVPLIAAGPDADRAAAESVRVEMLTPQVSLTPAAAAQFNGLDEQASPTLLGIGLGALGSQVFANLARQGYGQWTIVDKDYLLPHNFARHAVMGRRVGLPKASEMAQRANDLFSSLPIARAIVADILKPGEQTDALAQAALEAVAILDMSASIAVSRHLTLDIQSPAKRITSFVSPSGLDLVVMSEGVARQIQTDCIEAQYLRAVVNDVRLHGHLVSEDDQVRYGGSCRDLSSRISQEAVALHAAIGAAAIRKAVDDPNPMLAIWRHDPVSMSIARCDIELHAPLILEAGEWAVVVDGGLQERLMTWREEKLPKETCGVLLGRLDTYNRRIYLVDALAAPPDNEEEPGGCLRGTAGVQNAVAQASSATLQQVDYIGEWHSHPDGCSCEPSKRDLVQMQWLKSRMHPEGKPGLILIVCEHNTLLAFLSQP